MPNIRDETGNVLVSAFIIALVVLLASIFALWLLTKNPYLDAYFTLEAFFDAQNTAASTALASFALAANPGELFPILAIVVIDNLSRILIISFIIAAVIDLVMYSNIEELINEFRTRQLSRHIIISGYNELVDALIDKLQSRNAKFVVIEPDKEQALLLNKRHVMTIVGSASDEEDLKLANIGKASTIVFASQEDLANVEGALTAKKLNSRVRIMARASSEEVRRKMYLIGVDMTVIPEYLAGIELGRYIARG